MYELLINVDNTWKAIDFGEDKPAMNYQANDIAELKDRQADYSQALKLPMSANNLKLFGLPHYNHIPINIGYGDEIIGRRPYNRIPCRLYANGFTLAGEGSFLYISKLTQFIEVQILSGTADFFETLKDKDFSDVDFSYFIPGVDYDKQPTSQVLKYAVANYKNDEAYTVTTRCPYPFTVLTEAVKTIVNNAGYELLHNITEDIALLSISSRNASNTDSFNSMEPFKAKTRYVCRENYVHVLGATLVFDSALDETESFKWRNTINGTIPTATVSGYSPKFDGTANLKVYVKSDILNEANYLHVYTRNNNSNFEQQEWVPIYNDGKPFTLIQKFKKGDYIAFEIGAYRVEGSGSSQTRTGADIESCSVEIEDFIVSDNIVPNLGRVYVAPNLGFAKQLDLFKLFTQVYGLTIKVDNANKKVYAYTMDMLYANRSKALNWDAKIFNNSKRTKSFALQGYGVKNKIVLEDNSDKNYTDVGVFTISNETLEAEKELFKISAESGVDEYTNGSFSWYYGNPSLGWYNAENVAKIPLENADGSWKGCKTHIVYIDYRVWITSGISPAEPEDSSLYIVKHLSAQNIIDKYYNYLVNYMLHPAVMFEDDLHITTEDIEKFDQFKPVYLEKLGGFFYVNKIKNFIAGQLTKCELIKL